MNILLCLHDWMETLGDIDCVSLHLCLHAVS